jgi:hypothetical protein
MISRISWKSGLSLISSRILLSLQLIKIYNVKGYAICTHVWWCNNKTQRMIKMIFFAPSGTTFYLRFSLALFFVCTSFDIPMWINILYLHEAVKIVNKIEDLFFWERRSEEFNGNNYNTWKLLHTVLTCDIE